MYYATTFPTPVGNITLACDKDGTHLVGLWAEGQKYFGGAISNDMTTQDDIPLFETVKGWLDNYFSGNRPDISKLPLAPIGGEFRQQVWSILREIPYGQVLTYGDIAKRMAKKMGKPTMSSQAVGGAVAHNPILIILPCHRVVGTNGSLTGFAGGIEMKIKLLELEGAKLDNLFVPKKGTAL